MLHGFLIFNSSSGVLLFQKKFTKGFGLAAAATNPSVADPVSLALQLFAFQKYSGGLENELLELISLGSCKEGDVHLAYHGNAGSNLSGLAEGKEGSSGTKMPLTLALFSSFPYDLSRHLANGILETFVMQFATTLQAAPAHSAPALGRFESLEGFLQQVPDTLVSNLIRRVPHAIEWLLVLWGDVSTENATPPSVTQPQEKAPGKGSSPRKNSSSCCCSRTSSSPDPLFDGVVATSNAPSAVKRSSSAPTSSRDSAAPTGASKRSRSGSRGLTSCLPRWGYWRKRERIAPDLTEVGLEESSTAKPPSEGLSLSSLSCCYMSSSSCTNVAPQFIEKLVGAVQETVQAKDTAHLTWSPEEGMSRMKVAVLTLGPRLILAMPLPVAASALKLEPLRDSLRSDLLSLRMYLSFLSDVPRSRVKAERPPRMPAAQRA